MGRRARQLSPETEIRPGLSSEEELLLDIVLRAGGPVGARLAGRQLREAGVVVSEATISRMFKRLDDCGLTAPSGQKGRTLTEQGSKTARELSTRQRRDEAFTRALDIRNVEQLLDLLHGRRGVERELAGRAATKATAEDLERLEGILRSHEDHIAAGHDTRQVGMDFHRAVAEIAGSDLLQVLASIVLNDSLVPLEKVLDVITGGHGTVGQSAPEHEEILSALRRRDPVAAEEAMARHISRLIDEVAEFAESDHVKLFDRLLMFTR
ncbi:FCD domain-containing protein [Nonomuraea sp. CA-141351]|uniref:FadR/GntR family transcriptional regulator n=1 Tax=Nonomuraea sp. CA-141351 TaxID=3239996 RepID=UPI003D8FB905